MTRIPLDVAADICGVQPGTIRRWVHDGRLTRHWNGYDFNDLIHARDTRNLAALLSRAGIKHADRAPCTPTETCVTSALEKSATSPLSA